MKTLTPHLREASPSQRLDLAFRTVLTVPKDRLLKEEAKLKRIKNRRKKSKESG
jgi:hypothetical protein